MKRDWYVLHVKPRTEKKVAQYLLSYGYFCHLPLYTKIAKVQRRKVKRRLPLFPGYVFTRLLPDERVKMLQTNLIVKTIFAKYPRKMIHQLRQIAHAARGDTTMMPIDLCKVGDYVRVISGPMRGTEGYIQRKGREASLCLNVEILGVAVEVAVSPYDVEKIDAPNA
jgi:transcription antitermination factor NusG